jgi:hypothetical protein
MITIEECRLEALGQLAMITRTCYGMVSRVPLWARWDDSTTASVVGMQWRAYREWQAAEARLRLAQVLYAPQQSLPTVVSR